jgi:hypothetical protein
MAAQVPIPLQVAILHKLLIYDRTLGSRLEDGFHVAVVFEPSSEPSKLQRAAFEKSFSEAPLTVRGNRYDPLMMAAERLAEDGKDLELIVICVGVELTPVLEHARSLHAVTFATEEAAVRAGAVAAVINRNDKPRLFLNVSASIAAGMDLDPQVLALAELVGRP